MSVANDHYTVTGSARRIQLVTKGTAFTYGAARALCVGTAGTLNFTDGDGNAHTNYPAQAGYNPIIVNSIQAGGTATDIWALF